MLIPILDAGDERLSDYRDLTDVGLRRRFEPEAGLYIAESGNVIERAIDAGHRPRSLLMARRWLPLMEPIIATARGAAGDPHGGPVPVYLASEAVLREVTGYHVHRGALAAMHRPRLPSVTELLAAQPPQETTSASRVAVLENLVDHTNVGAAFRAAAAMGVDAVLVTPGCADPFYRRSVRVSMGTVFQVPWTRIEAWPGGIDELRGAGYTVAGMTLGEGAITLDELVARDPAKLALIFGAEGHGLSRAAERGVDWHVTIPMMNGVDSLNVAAASAVAFYATRPRTPGPAASRD
ncbi:MAG TPA: RNA methyltransferase [Actinomycetaceae bacterium]|nr:RNA methyltransferase [Actinomycetaceae bacterium]